MICMVYDIFWGRFSNTVLEGSSPGTEVRTLTNQSSLTVPDVNITKVNRSTSPFHFRPGRNKEKKRLEKQAHASEESGPCLLSLSSQSSIGTSFENESNTLRQNSISNPKNDSIFQFSRDLIFCVKSKCNILK